ncbi:unnamed protein product [Ranitomeya imitator]|uniref:RNA exonuclease 1 homolog-like domain-containing protein n=1 Tax=Ranitomeya imitator TaxID=111125 RepID=A0ABN9LP14_9NEOB|nr:unnamed protein product [Ranitomeya imitator]
MENYNDDRLLLDASERHSDATHKLRCTKRSLTGKKIDFKTTIYNKLKKYVLTPEQLKENSYPLVHPEKSESAVLFTEDGNKNLDSSCKICCRCGAEYLVTPKGNCVRKEECVHHWGRLRRLRVPGGWETHYSCCSGAVGSSGCQVAKRGCC